MPGGLRQYASIFVKYGVLLLLVLSCALACVWTSQLLRSGLFSIRRVTSLNGRAANLAMEASQNILIVEQDSATLEDPVSVFKREDGSFLWNTWHAAGDHPIDDGQRVYLWVTAPDQPTALEALRLSDGKEVWQYADTLSQPGSMQLVNGTLYDTYSTGSASYYTVALNATTGTLLWKETNAGTPGMQVVGPVMYQWGLRGIEALRAQDGSLLWSWSDTNYINNTQMVIQGNTLYYLSGYTARAFAASNGKQLWEYTQSGSDAAGNLIGAMGGVVYVEQGILLHAFRGSDGTMLWSQAAAENPALQYQYGGQNSPKPFAMDASLIYEMDRNTLTVFSTKDGTRLWSYTENASTGLTSLAVPGQVGGTVYVQIPRAEVVALDASTGQQIWQAPGESSALLGATLYSVQSIYSGDPVRDIFSPPPSTCHLTITLSSLDAAGTVNWKQSYSHLCP